MIGETIKHWRIKRKLTQQQLADIIGYKDVKCIGKYENGRKTPSYTTLLKIMDAMNVEIFFRNKK